MKFSIVMPYRRTAGRAVLFYWVVAWWEAHFPEAQLCIGENYDEPFHRGKARNAAAALAANDVLLIADADTVPNPGAVAESLDLVVNETAAWALPYADERYYNLSSTASTKVIAGNPGTTVPEPGTGPDVEHKITSVAGCLVLRAADYRRIGGYDDRFTGWGGEDVAFAHALDLVVGPHHRSDSYICHLWHPIAPHSTFDGDQWADNGRLERDYRSATTARQVLDVRFA